MEMRVEWVMKENGLAYRRGSRGWPNRRDVAGCEVSTAAGSNSALGKRDRSDERLVPEERGD